MYIYMHTLCRSYLISLVDNMAKHILMSLPFVQLTQLK